MRKELLLSEDVFTLTDVFNAAELDGIIRATERHGYEAAPLNSGDASLVRTDVRNNGRVIWDDAALAQRIFARLRAQFPARYQGRALKGLNERFRFYRYQPGEFFAPHHDFPFERNEQESSALTLMVYLNDSFTGGTTDFYREDLTRLLSVAPRPGLALIFRHDLLHAGTAVTQGRKYVLRTDVMYGAKGVVL